MEIESKEFSNKDITVTYDPCICQLSRKCAKELSNVFSDSVIPWVNLDDGKTEDIIKQIKRCPSGALQYHKKYQKLVI
ncbi:(4Fe-4S)-binding protein [Hyunsoonleella ulvae]|uniref:(4Fe-4S)-binding protein n=1 Tax=Hyunsoonleella ulvae TaxID=2799948 RepID=UPI00193A7AF5|nr:(4Fe-4S)-binding protein [Hyunsoonleella ulvae]